MSEIIPSIFILILNWNGKENTIECLESVTKINYPNYHIVVMDNGSVDDSVLVIKKQFPQVTLIENKANLGFAAGNNVGIDYAISKKADYILLLNNDTIVDREILLELIAASKLYAEGSILGAKIYYYKERQKIWFAGAEWLPEQANFQHIGIGTIDDDTKKEAIKETDYICGCALLIKSEVVKKIGTLEPNFFLMWEETDWCYRAKRAGYKCLLVPNAKVWHKISSSFAGGDKAPHYQYFWWRNRMLWMERNLSSLEAFAAYAIVYREIFRQIRKYFNPNIIDIERIKIKAALQGVKDYLLRNFGDCPSWVRCHIK
jgi:GT2 family glycosyltransferase